MQIQLLVTEINVNTLAAFPLFGKKLYRAQQHSIVCRIANALTGLRP
jgi:hypothetical protein